MPKKNLKALKALIRPLKACFELKKEARVIKASDIGQGGAGERRKNRTPKQKSRAKANRTMLSMVRGGGQQAAVKCFIRPLRAL